MELCVDRRSQRPGDRLHQCDARGVQDRFGRAFEDQHVRRVPHVVVGLDHQQFGVDPRLGEMPFGGLYPMTPGAVSGM